MGEQQTATRMIREHTHGPSAVCLDAGCDWSASAGARAAGNTEHVAREHVAWSGHPVSVVVSTVITAETVKP